MSLRILHCPTVVGGNGPALSHAQRALGANSWSVSITPNPYGYPVDEDLYRGRSWLQREFARWKMIMRALRDYEVIHFNFGRGLSPIRSRVRGKGPLAPVALLRNLLYAAPFELCDLRWARRRGKVIAVTYQGDDARQGDVARGAAIHFAHEVANGYYTRESDRQARSRIAQFDRCADLVYALNPDLLTVLPPRAQFQAYCSVDMDAWMIDPAKRDTRDRRPRIVHAPSHREVKGTRHVLAAVEQVRAGGVDVELVLVENVTNLEARKVYETADLAIDQVLAGFYGALAVELMALELPVICYLRDEDIARLPAAMRSELPLINATPATLAAVLREWIVDRRGEWRERGRRSREFVQRWHNPRRIAQETLRDYERIWDRKHMNTESGRGVSARS